MSPPVKGLEPEKGLEAPLSQWRQESAFDSAKACEAWKLEFLENNLYKLHPRRQSASAIGRKLEEEADEWMETWRCLPATVVEASHKRGFLRWLSNLAEAMNK
jgi:hypothetical protein